MQQQLKEGEFCPPDYPKVICKAGPRVVWVGLHKSGFTELCSVTKRPTETPLAAATRKLNQLKDKAVAYQTRQQMLQVGRARVWSSRAEGCCGGRHREGAREEGGEPR